MRIAIAISNFLLRIGVDIRKCLFSSILAGFGGKLEYIVCGGAPLQVKYIRVFRAIGIEILNAYGITECSPGVAISRNFYHKDGSVGQIIKGCVVRIQNSEIQVQGKMSCWAITRMKKRAWRHLTMVGSKRAIWVMWIVMDSCM